MVQLDNLLLELTTALRRSKLKISSAESCTGGLIAGLLTELPGSSIWFDRGFVTYSNLAKQEMLGVDPQLIKNHGAVSEQVAIAMAKGALLHSAAQLSFAVTGIAGPDGGSAEKPVGTVWFAWAMQGLPVDSLERHFTNASRQEVRHLACVQALEGAIQQINQAI